MYENSVGNIFPYIKEVIFEVVYKDKSGFCESFSQVYKINREQRAFFKIPCPQDGCVAGGYDLNKAIMNMLRSTTNKFEGFTSCQGWQGIGGIGKNRCCGDAEYKIEIIYSE